jgi:predicted MPP superfamily phosphohydrolase
MLHKVVYSNDQEHLTTKLGSTLVGSGTALFILNLFSAFSYPGDNFGLLRVLAWTTFLHIPLFLAATTCLFWKKLKILAIISGIATLILILITVDAFLIEPQWLETSYVTLNTSKLDTPLRIAIIADIQTDHPDDYERDALQKAMDAQPDLILFAGDYIHMGKRSQDYVSEITALNHIFKDVNLDASLGVYAIQGNVDWGAAWQNAFADLPASTFEQTSQVDLGPAILTVLSMQDSFNASLPIDSRDKFHIVMGHSPNFSLGSVQADLLVAGHTHGGQVQLPLIGPILTLSQVPRAWASGVTEITPDKTLIVSRGIGLERGHAPRLRFFCRPELVIVDLLPANP